MKVKGMETVFRDPESGKLLEKIDVLVRDTGEKIGYLDGNNALNSLKLGNRTLDTDLYELTMAAGYFKSGKGEQRACFDLYDRQNPDGGGFCIFAGLELRVVAHGTHRLVAIAEMFALTHASHWIQVIMARMLVFGVH